ncbi:replication endonuclease, partial [Neisseria sp. P0003.S004]|uniref:replication endonuclease n=1 Tax=Neisseria sp. P0003.S004 TaxID=3436659 RepID=UPI003F7DA66B
AMIIENIDNPEEQVELFDMFLKSSSNPALRRNEMMVRLRGLEEWAEENNNEALFLTLTAPSSFHAGNSNKKWSGVNPRDTQNYLN